jgi:hypothetical protein
VIPSEGALEGRDVVLAQREARVLLGGAARDVDQRGLTLRLSELTTTPELPELLARLSLCEGECV